MNSHFNQLATAALVLVLVACALLMPTFMPKFLLFQTSIVLTYAMAILGLNLLLGFSGQVSLAQGAFFAFGAYAFAILSDRFALPLGVALMLAPGLTVVIGMAVAIPALRLPGLQLAIVTYGLAALVPQIIIKLDHITGGEAGIRLARRNVPAWYQSSVESWNYYTCLAGFGLCALVMWRVLHGDGGRSLRALRDNPLVAASLGVNTVRVRLVSFAIASAFAGLGGGLYAMVNSMVNPSSFEASRSIEFLIGAIVGGLTSVWGSIVGAIFVVFVPDWTSQIDTSIAAMLYGICVIVMMLFARRGVAGLVSDTWDYVSSSIRKTSNQV